MAGKTKIPYTPDFGRVPDEMIPRPMLTADIINTFLNDTSGKRVRIVTGTRGSGKTVFAESVCRQIQNEKSWISAFLNPERDMLRDLAAALCGRKNLKEMFTAAKINLSAFGLGPQIKGVQPETDPEAALAKMLGTLKRRRKKVLITVDGASNNSSTKLLISALQGFMQKDLPVYLLLTGLYDHVRSLQGQETLTCLHHIPLIPLTPLNTGRMEESYARVFGLDSGTALEMARQTKGYAVAFQALGYFTWKNRKEPERAVAETRQYLEEYVYERIWSDLSAEDRRVLYGIANTPDGSVASIREYLQESSNRFTPYRTRLIRKGIINGDSYGVVRFELPLFDEFVLKNYPPE